MTAIRDLESTFSKLGFAAAISVAAYIVGAVSQSLTGFIITLVRASKEGLYGSGLLIGEGPSSFRRGSETIAAELVRPVADQIDNSSSLRITEESKERLQAMRKGLSEDVNLYYVETYRELELPATLLVGDRDDIYAEVDRLRAEGELRIAVVPPLTALLVLLGIVESAWWLSALAGVAVLAWQGTGRIDDSRRVIRDFFEVGGGNSPALGRFKDRIDRRKKDVDSALAEGEIF